MGQVHYCAIKCPPHNSKSESEIIHNTATHVAILTMLCEADKELGVCVIQLVGVVPAGRLLYCAILGLESHTTNLFSRQLLHSWK